MAFGDEDKIFKGHNYRVRKFNRSTAVISGTLEIKQPLDNSMTFSYEAFNFAGGQYKKIAGNVLGSFCDVLYGNTIKPEMKRLFDHSNVSSIFGSCPLPVGFYNYEDYAPNDFGEYLPDYVPGNERWRSSLYFIKNGQKLGGLTVYAILRDNQKLFDSKFG